MLDLLLNLKYVIVAKNFKSLFNFLLDIFAVVRCTMYIRLDSSKLPCFMSMQYRYFCSTGFYLVNFYPIVVHSVDFSIELF